MAKTLTTGRTLSKTGKATTKKKTAAKKKATARKVREPAITGTNKISEHKLDNVLEQLKELGDKVGKSTDRGFHEAIDVTRLQLKKFRDSLNKAADQGVHAVKDVADKIHQFSSEATDLTKLKFELHNLQNEHERLLMLMGEQMRNLYKADKLKNIKSKLKYDFRKLDELESGIADKEKEVNRLIADLKAIR